MKTINFTNPHRQKHFQFFNKMNHPHLNITVEVEVQHLINFVKEASIKFTPTMVYTIAKAVNNVKEFKWRIRGEEVVEHNVVHPSYAVHTKASPVFSFCTVGFQPILKNFIKAALQVEAKMQQTPSFEDTPGRDDYLFLSSIPWFHFTAIQHAMHYHPCDSVPRFTFGKYIKKQNKMMMPLSIQVHHALVNGKEVGQFLEILQQFLNEPKLG